METLALTGAKRRRRAPSRRGACWTGSVPTVAWPRWGIWLAIVALLAVLVAVWPLARKALVFGLAEEAPLALAAVGFALCTA